MCLISEDVIIIKKIVVLLMKCRIIQKKITLINNLFIPVVY